MSLLQPYQPRGFLAGKERALAKKSKAEADALAKENASLDISKKRAEFEEYMNTAQERKEAREMALLKTETEIEGLRDEIDYRETEREQTRIKSELEAEYKEQQIEESKAREGKLDEEAIKLQKEGTHFGSLTSEMTKGAITDTQKSEQKIAYSAEILRQSLSELKANPELATAGAKVKGILYAWAQSANSVIPDNPVTNKVMDELGESFKVGNIAKMQGALELATQALIPISSGFDVRFTVEDRKNAQNLNQSSKFISTPEQTIPILERSLMVLDNVAQVKSMLVKTSIGTATELKEKGFITYNDEGRLVRAPTLKGEDGVPYLHPIMEVPNNGSQETLAIMHSSPKGAIIRLLNPDGSVTIKRKD